MLHTFDETHRCQLYHYDVVVIQLAALGFIKDTTTAKQGSTQQEATTTTGHNSVDQTQWHNNPTTGALGTAGKYLGGQRNGTARTQPTA